MPHISTLSNDVIIIKFRLTGVKESHIKKRLCFLVISMVFFSDSVVPTDQDPFLISSLPETRVPQN